MFSQFCKVCYYYSSRGWYNDISEKLVNTDGIEWSLLLFLIYSWLFILIAAFCLWTQTSLAGFSSKLSGVRLIYGEFHRHVKINVCEMMINGISLTKLTVLFIISWYNEQHQKRQAYETAGSLNKKNIVQKNPKI